MVPAKSWSAPPILDDGFSVFNAKAVAALNEILDGGEASILLTTSHKYRFSISEWINIFQTRGINVNQLDRLPRNDGHLNRLDEVTRWFSTSQNIEDFVILDDDTSLNGLSDYLKARLISTKSMIGLNASHVQECLNILYTPLTKV